MGHYSSLSPSAIGDRDVIGAWFVCLLIAGAFFGSSLLHSHAVERDAAASAPAVAAPVEVCARDRRSAGIVPG